MYSKNITMPILFGVKGLLINYTDILTYFTLKTFIPTDRSSTIILTYEDIALRIGTTESFIKSSISKLVLLELILQQKDFNGFTYRFTAVAAPEMVVPLAILDADLSFEEKAALLLCKLSCLENPVDVMLSIRMFSELAGINVATMLELVENLEAKKHLRTVCVKGKKPKYYFQLCGSIDWTGKDNNILYKSYSEVYSNTNLVDIG